MRLQLVTVPAGPFAMGCDDGQPDERPVHTVWVDEFALAVHPVTNRDYRAFVAATGHAAPALASTEPFDLPDQPVVAVSWFDAIAYCTWLREVTDLHCRLPTEAEREKAALGGKPVRYPWGNDEGPHSLGPLDAPLVVGQDQPNALGLHNMGDLVHEWCSDWYDASYYERSPERNPQGPTTGARRSSRGGSWRHRVCVTRCGARSSIPPERCYSDYGFRIAVGLTRT